MARPSRRLAAAALGLAGAALALLLPRRAPVGEGGPMPPARHEERDVGFRPMLLGGALLLGGIGAIMGLALWLYPASTQDQSMARPLPRFPDPQLQPDPPADMAAFRARQLRQLGAAYWIDRPSGRLHLPVDQAMRAVAREGIADWPTR